MDTGEYEMTVEVHVKNANTDWRDTHRVRVTVQEQNEAGEWNDAPYEQPVLLAAGAILRPSGYISISGSSSMRSTRNVN